MLCQRALAASLLLVLSACGGSDVDSQSANAREGADDRMLTALEESEVLTEIDNICGDTWCEGDFDYSFDMLDCSKSTKSCRFEFAFVDRVWDDNDDDVLSERQHPAGCTFEGISSKDDVLRVRNGRITYTDALYDRVSECIDSHTAAASDHFALDDIRRFVDACSSADVVSVAVVRVPNTSWDEAFMKERAMTLGLESTFPSANRDGLSFDVGTDMGSDLSSTEACAEQAAGWTSWRKAMRIEATNYADEMGTIILLRYDSSWQAQIPEVQIRLGYAN
jgi:hypothetical protein